MIQRYMSFLLSLLLAFPAPFWPSVTFAVVSREADVALTEKLAGSERLAGELRKALNRSAFDTEALLFSLDYDYASIVRFVREDIAFEQYEGLLRGPQGTLMSQAGNSLDQAVLLAKLLRDAGYDARVARGTLNEGDVRKLLRQMATPRPPIRSIGDVGRGIAIAKEYGLMTSLDDVQTGKVQQALERPPAIKTMPEFELFESTTANLQAEFDSFAATEPGKWEQALLDEAQDYFWVEAKDEAADSWRSIHPVLPADGTVTPQRVSTIADSVPEELQHRIRLRMFIDRSVGGQLTTAPVMDAWERPTANLVGVPVAFAVLPDSASDAANIALPPEQIISKANFFVPMLLSGPAPGARYFDLAGNLIDPMAASSAASGVVKQVGKAFGEAAGAIGDHSNVPRLKAVWLEISLIAPGGREVQYRRTLVSADDPSRTEKSAEAENSLAYLMPLLRTNTLVVAAGRTPRGIAIDGVLAQWQKTVSGVKALSWGLDNNPSLSNKEKSSLAEVPGYWHGHLAMLSRFDLVEDWSDQHRLYRHEPMVAIHTTGVGDADEGMSQVDIVHNSRRAFDIGNTQPRFDPRAQIAAGVWETLTEGSMLQPGERMGAMKVLQAAQEQGIPLQRIQPGDPTSDLPVDAHGVQHVKADLDRGFTVLIPKERPAGFERTGWWRVDPQTGETLGLLDDGRGVELSEAMTVTIGIAGLVFLHYSLYGCFSQAYGAHGSDVNFQLLCCVTFNYGSMLLMALVGAAVGVALTEGAADMIGLSVDVLDFGVGLDGMFCNAILN